MTRKEDERFIRGQGLFVDDVQLPGMLHGAMLRSPLRARPDRVDRRLRGARAPQGARGHHRRAISRRAGWPGCRRCRATPRRCWPPTRSASRARRSRSSSPRTATRPATRSSWSRSSTSRCASWWTRGAALDADAPVIRDDHPGRTEQPHLRLGGRRRGGAPTRCSPRRGGGRAGHASSRARTRRRWRRAARSPTFDRVGGKLTLWCTTQAPHAHRTLYALVTGLARAQDPGDLARRRRRLRQQGAGLSRLRVRDRRRR